MDYTPEDNDFWQWAWWTNTAETEDVALMFFFVLLYAVCLIELLCKIKMCVNFVPDQRVYFNNYTETLPLDLFPILCDDFVNFND